MRLSANENPYGTSPLVREAILSYVTYNDANYYPDGNATDLRMKLAAYWKVQPEQLVICLLYTSCICRLENCGLRSNWCFDCYYNTTICYCVMNKLDKFIELIVL